MHGPENRINSPVNIIYRLDNTPRHKEKKKKYHSCDKNKSLIIFNFES